VLFFVSLAVLAALGELPWLPVVIMAVREAAVTVQRSVLDRRGVAMPASLFGKGKTLSQVFAITLYLAPAVPTVLADVALWVAVVITLLSGIEYGFRGRRIQRDR
jgi:CDP-diacylglycerol---glycerol-3-phosphate 3-phosphatidyltransferase